MAGQCYPVCLAMCVPRAVSFTLCANCLSLPLVEIIANCLWLCMCLWEHYGCLLSQICILLFINWMLIVILINYFRKAIGVLIIWCIFIDIIHANYWGGISLYLSDRFLKWNKNMGEFLVNVLLKYNAIIQLLSKG